MAPQARSTGSKGGQPALLKTLGMWDGLAILVGITIGAGIFATPQNIAQYFSSFWTIALLWAVCGVFIFFGGLIYSELGTRLPQTGGEYIYISRSFGPFLGFLYGWSQLIIIRTSPAAGLSLVAVNYLGYFVEMGPRAKVVTALGIILALGVLNYVGVRGAAAFQRVTTSIKVGGIFAIVLLGLALMLGTPTPGLTSQGPPPSGLGPAGGFSAAMILIIFSFLGFDRVGYLAGEMRDPRRIVPLTMALGIATVTVTYLLVNLIYHYTLGIEGVRGSEIVASQAAVVLMGPIGAGFVAFLAIVSTIGSTNGTTLSSSRVYYAMARDGLFFSWLNHVHPRFHTPSRAVVAHCLWAGVILLLRGNFGDIAKGMVFAILLFFFLNTLALFRLRARNVGENDNYKVPFYPFLPAVFLAGLALLITLRIAYEPRQSMIDLAFIASGLPFSLFWLKKRKSQAAG